MTNLSKYQQDLERLVKKGGKLLYGLGQENFSELSEAEKIAYKGKESADFRSNYEDWYSESFEILRQILPNRLEDFKHLYKPESKRKEINFGNYTLSDYMIGLTVRWAGEPAFSIFKAAIQKFYQQFLILKSAEKRFDSSLFDIETLLQADLFDSEIEASKELLKKGFVRAAGAICGVILEAHLQKVLKNHGHTLKKKNPGIADFNNKLKEESIIEITDWRKIQHLADIRNTCDHNKKLEPTQEDIKELIAGTEKIIKNIF